MLGKLCFALLLTFVASQSHSDSHDSHPHHSRDAHFPKGNDHYDHRPVHADHTSSHRPAVFVALPKPHPHDHRVDHRDHRDHRDHQHSHQHQHDHHSDPAPHKAPPGYPSSDFVKYFAKYTSRGGQPVQAPHQYYNDHQGHLANYGVEPENAAPRERKLAHLQGAVDAPKPSDPHASQRNFVAAGNGFHRSAGTGSVPSPSGEGPINGFYFGNRARGGKIFIGDRPFYFK